MAICFQCGGSYMPKGKIDPYCMECKARMQMMRMRIEPSFFDSILDQQGPRDVEPSERMYLHNRINELEGERNIAAAEVRKLLNKLAAMEQTVNLLRVQMDMQMRHNVQAGPDLHPDAEMLRRLIQLCHPDRHANSLASQLATKYLLALKK